MSIKLRNELDVVPVQSAAGLVSDFDVFAMPEVDTSDGGPGAKQSFKDECDINKIMARAQVTGVSTWLEEREPSFGDFEEFDFQRSMNIVVKANEMFEALPSSMRKRFHNSPDELLNFLADGSNREEAIKLGLVSPPKVEAVPEPVSVRIIADPVVPKKD